MIRDIYENILKGQEIRKNLIALKMELKEAHNKTAFLYGLAGDYTALYKLLEAEDPKVRKNAALIMGELAVPEFMNKLYAAYQNEDKLFIKSDYLTAIRHFDYHVLLEKFKKRLDFLTSNTFEETSLKHVREEIRILTDMLIKMEKPSMHEFTGFNELSDLILLTNRDHQKITLDQISKGISKEFGAGVLVRTKDLHEIINIRTFSDLLFRLNDVSATEHTPKAVARAIYEGGILAFLNTRHEGTPPYYFRIEIKSKMALDKKSIFAKKTASELEGLSERQLINSTSNYEVEIRLIESKEGAFNVLIKLYTIKDQRFKYRKNAVAASIAPVNAALIAALAKDYLKEGAQVLDPFCGVGTMLIERNKCARAKTMYGLDVFGEAIDKARENSAIDDTVIHFINRDFFDFKHEYLFDEIFTNMPARGGRKTEEEIELLYIKFFEKALEVLQDEAIIVMYTRDKELVRKHIRYSTQYTMLKEYEISKKEDAHVCILQARKL
ncbi:TRM11 family SAM-dependent methyltransferase [Cellulosilyticum sp. I15G10I2]|uniref:TRM11 family SAM-dependent methyltransferase n=1 Tax=Cellulosilyticum sp. I15G10I2 TaxID=1892843 RepID=UPI00085C059D|nr:methyltransferase domain-containing protein [Cellulosilyticum sp. I15G10I2]